MESSFASPQHQSPIGIVIMFLDAIQEYARALGPILIVIFFRFSDADWTLIAAAVAGLLVVMSGIAYLKFRNFTFYLDETVQEFIVTEGVFNKTRTSIQLRKIQQVDIRQNLVQGLIGVHTLEVDSAGTNKQEIAIRAISEPVAMALKARLLDNENLTEEQVLEAPVVEKPFIRISFASLFKVGITANYLRSLGILLAFFASTYENIRRLSESVEFDQSHFKKYFAESVLMESIALIIVAFLVMVLIINLGRIVIRYFNYTIRRQSGSLLLTYGLISTRSTIVKPSKVQIFSYAQNFFQKKMDVTEVRIHEATAGDREKRKQAIDIPGCSARERDALMKLVFAKIPHEGVMLKPNFRKLIFSIFLAIVLPLSVFYLAAFNIDERLLRFDYAAVLYVAAMLTILWFGFRNYRLFIADDFIIKQSGAWDIKKEIIEPNRIQALTTSQLFWHKGADIGYLTIHTAGGDISFQLGDFKMIRHYVNLWLYEMERSDSNWN